MHATHRYATVTSNRCERLTWNRSRLELIEAIFWQDNTLVHITGRAMLCDFGLAKIVEDVPSGLTTSSLPLGTPAYMSPELLNVLDASHTANSDVWSWGCLLLVVSLRRGLLT